MRRSTQRLVGPGAADFVCSESEHDVGVTPVDGAGPLVSLAAWDRFSIRTGTDPSLSTHTGTDRVSTPGRTNRSLGGIWLRLRLEALSQFFDDPLLLLQRDSQRPVRHRGCRARPQRPTRAGGRAAMRCDLALLELRLERCLKLHNLRTAAQHVGGYGCGQSTARRGTHVHAPDGLGCASWPRKTCAPPPRPSPVPPPRHGIPSDAVSRPARQPTRHALTCRAAEPSETGVPAAAAG